MLNVKQESYEPANANFLRFFGMTWRGIESRFTEYKADALTTRPRANEWIKCIDQARASAEKISRGLATEKIPKNGTIKPLIYYIYTMYENPVGALPRCRRPWDQAFSTVLHSLDEDRTNSSNTGKERSVGRLEELDSVWPLSRLLGLSDSIIDEQAQCW